MFHSTAPKELFQSYAKVGGLNCASWSEEMGVNKIAGTPFAAAVRHLRKGKGLTQGDLAAKIEMSQGLIAAIENEGAHWGVSGKEQTRRKVAAALGWSYEAMLELGRLLQDGIEGQQAEARALSIHAIELPPPLEGATPENVRGYRIHNNEGISKSVLWVHKDLLVGRKVTALKAWEVNEQHRTVALVDTEDINPVDGGVFLVRLKDLALRKVRKSGAAWVMTGPWGETDAIAGKPSRWVVGRVLWFTMQF